MEQGNNRIKIPGFYVNLDWNSTIQKLTDSDAGRLLKNMFNYALEDPLIETSEVVTAISEMVIFRTIDINKEKYIEKCRTNKLNGEKGGRPIGSKNKNPEKPNGLFENPEKAKSRNNSNNKEKAKAKLELDTSARIKQMKKIVEMDLNTITGEDQIEFCMMVKEQIKYLGWNRFEILVFYTDENKVEELLAEYGFPGLLEGILGVKESYEYLLDSVFY
jgi:hypothetical protein